MNKQNRVVISELNNYFPVIIKTINPSYDEDTLQYAIESLNHEAVVSYEGTNKLRELGFMNFVYMYATFNCG